MYIKLVKGKIYKFMTEMKTRKYIDQIPAIVEGLNGRYVGSIGTSPDSVTIHNEIGIFHRRYDHIFQHQIPIPAFRVGDYCRLRLQKKETLKKAYTQTFDDQIFRISAIRNAPPVLMYEIEDLEGNKIDGRWYKESLYPIIYEVGE